jgi:pimeloyl-ACP methyl ester carboxylesterase
MAVAVESRVVPVDGVQTFYRCTGGSGPPTVFVHGNPTSSEDWLPFMRRLRGPAIALDLPGWGDSERPSPRRFDYSFEALGGFVARFLDRLGVAEHSLVVHDWGALGLIAAQQHPQRLRRLVVINAVPLLAGYRWHWVARYFWRVHGVGELANATTTRAGLKLLSRQATPRRGGMPEEFIDQAWRSWRSGTRPEILRLYRSADPHRLEAAGRRLGEITCPALVVWGTADPFLPARFATAYAKALPAAELLELADAGHWPWIDRPDLVDRVAGFVGD